MANLKCFIKTNLIFILLILLVIFLDFGIFNNAFYISRFAGLTEKSLEISSGTLKNFTIVNSNLLSETEDPYITFNQINERIKYISISCENIIPGALGQVFYRQQGQDFIEGNSIIFPISEGLRLIHLPNIQNVKSLRFDLTNQQGDILSCTELRINPKISYSLKLGNLVLLGIGLLGLIFGKRIISEQFSNTLWESLIRNGLLLFIILIIFLDFQYPPTITFDSAQYLFLSDILKSGNWADWDPLRNLVFPLQMRISTDIFGYQPIALLIPMILSHILLFVFSFLVIIEIFKPKSRWTRFLFAGLIFFIITLDPTIFGYYHVALTEYAAATLAMISSYLAIHIYKANYLSKQFFLLTAPFAGLIPLAWHIKQPYIGAAFFPLIIVCLLILFRNFSWKTILSILAIIIFMVILVLVSHFLWKNFINNRSDTLPEERFIFSQIESSLDNNRSILHENPQEFFSSKFNDYLISVNFKRTGSPIENKEYSLTYGFQNELIAHRLFLLRGSTNLIYENQNFNPFTKYYFSHYMPPVLINTLFLSRLKISHFLFTITYLLLPFLFLVFFLFWLKRKNITSTSIVILTETSLLNALGHLFIWPIDRYLFLGYPLNLLMMIIIVLAGVNYFQRQYFDGKRVGQNLEPKGKNGITEINIKSY